MRLLRVLWRSLAICLLLLVPGSAVLADTLDQSPGSGVSVTFQDVPRDYWARETIYSFAQRGLVSGYVDGSFRPEAGVTREEICKLMAVTFQLRLQQPAAATYSDVSPERWSYLYVEACGPLLSETNAGQRIFYPSAAATRQDIAAALVKLLGYTPSDAARNVSQIRRFTDSAQIAPELAGYIGLAVERGLVYGYPDGSFRPGAPVTRAEAVVLLSRAMGQAASELNANARLDYSADGATVFLTVTAEEGCTVSVNAERIKLEKTASTYQGQEIWQATYTYRFLTDGVKDFFVEVRKDGKFKTIDLTAEFDSGMPVLTITNCPEQTGEKQVTLTGTATDGSGKLNLTINGEYIYIGRSGSWSKTYDLHDGPNAFQFLLVNGAGKTVTETRTVNLVQDAPELVFTYCPETVTEREILLRGTIYDVNYDITLYLNGAFVDAAYAGKLVNWSSVQTLSPGANTFTFYLVNKAGRSVTETRTIYLDGDAPELEITNCPEQASTPEVTIRGRMFDANFPVTLTINGVYIDTASPGIHKVWSNAYTLQEGANPFVITLTNTAGKSVTVERTIVYGMDGPQLFFTECPETSPVKSVTIRGIIFDALYDVKLSVNGVPVESASAGSRKAWNLGWSLREGDNVLRFTLTNTLGRSVTETRIIRYLVSNPELVLLNWRDTVTSRQMTLRGTIYDQNYATSLYINGVPAAASAPGVRSSWDQTYVLEEGQNSFTFTLISAAGKTVTETRTITYTPLPPEIVFINCPERTRIDELMIRGKIVGNNAGVQLYINGEYVPLEYGYTFSYRQTLSPGQNTFVFHAINSEGQSETITRVVELVS